MLKVICTINFISAKNIAYAKLLKLQYFLKNLKKIQEIAQWMVPSLSEDRSPYFHFPVPCTFTLRPLSLAEGFAL